MPGEKAELRLAFVTPIARRLASDEGGGGADRVTVTVYARMVVPSWAVTTAVMVLLPSTRLIEPEGEPDVTPVPFTLTVEVASATIGVTVTDVTSLATVVT